MGGEGGEGGRGEGGGYLLTARLALFFVGFCVVSYRRGRLICDG